jgi:hypothetical protein
MVNIPELERVIAFLEDHPDQHDQKHWLNECGTAGCLAGWTAMLNGYRAISHDTFGWAGWTATVIADDDPDDPGNDVKVVAMKLLGLTEEDADVLFAPLNTRENMKLMSKDLANDEDLTQLWVRQYGDGAEYGLFGYQRQV